MANRFDDEVSIVLDKQRRLKLDLNALAEFEGLMGRSLLSYIAGKSGDQLQAEIGMREVRAMLWCALIHEDPALTVKDAGNLVNYAIGESLIDKVRAVFERVLEAFVLMCGPEAKKKLASLQESRLSTSPTETSSA